MHQQPENGFSMKFKTVSHSAPQTKSNISFPSPTPIFAAMNEHFRDIMRIVSKGDTSLVESFFRRPGGRKYLENITLILINALPHPIDEKEELYAGFVEVLDGMEQRIRRQKEGQETLENVFRNH